MSNKKELYYSPEIIIYPLLFLLAIVTVFWVESNFNLNFNYLGIYPRKLIGLRGILFGPFIHSNLNHLFNNSIPLLVLSTALFYFYRAIRWKVLIYGIFFTGLLTWIIGRPSLHIGASGVIYMLTSFLLFRGIFSKQYQLTALSFVVIFLYGGFIWYVFPTDEKISWEGHLSGLLVGFLFSLVFTKIHIKNKEYTWEKETYKPEEDLFMQHFDEDGNFVASEPVTKDDNDASETSKRGSAVIINYTYKEEKKED